MKNASATDATACTSVPEPVTTTTPTSLRAEPRARSEFIARVVHELRGQLGVVVGALHELELREEEASEARPKRLLAMARRGALRALRTADRLSRVTHLDSSLPLTSATPTDLGTIALRAYTEASLLEPNREIAVEIENETACTAEVSVDFAHAALVELFWVALKQTRTNVQIRIAPPCAIEIRTDGGTFQLERLRKGESLLQRSGVSLALALADVIARRHGGELRVDPHEGGVRCKISFGEARMKLLLVDDDEDTRELLSLYLAREGWAVDTKPSLADAKEALATGQYAVLLTDLSLPDGDGRELLAHGRPPGLRLAAVLSGSTSEAERAKSAAAGFDAHLTKPLDQNWFDKAIADIVVGWGTSDGQRR